MKNSKFINKVLNIRKVITEKVERLLRIKQKTYLHFKKMLINFVDVLLSLKLKTLIKNIASIQTGLFIKPDREGTILYLQVKHFDENGHLNEELHPDLKEYNVNPKYILQSGDILFAAKGSNNFAACYRNEEQPAVASTTFFVIRIMDKHILPEYLTWYINQPKSMDFLKGKAIGTSIPSISKAVLGELEVSIPSLHSQRIILELINLKNIERGLLSKIETLREQLFQQQIINALN